jgi:hypothetical protein
MNNRPIDTKYSSTPDTPLTQDDLLDMGMHDIVYVRGNITALRVMGGWIYTLPGIGHRFEGTTSTFVKEVE